MKRIPIDFTSIAEQHGVSKGTIYYSDTFNSWVLEGHPEIHLICIDAPFHTGEKLDGKRVMNVTIEDNQWAIHLK